MAHRLAPRARSLGAVALVIAVLLATPSYAFATRKLGLSSGTFKFDVAAGSQVSGQVIVMNDGTEPLKVMVYTGDQTVDAQGNITYSQPGRSDFASLGKPSTWVVIKMPENSKSYGNVPYVDLAPGQHLPVKFQITVPPGVPPGDHNVILFFESFVLPEAGQSATAQIEARLGSRVTLRVKGAIVQKLEVRPFIVPTYVIGGVVPYDFTVRNEGNVDQRVGARVTLLDRSDNVVQTETAIDGVTVFAQTNLESTGTLLAEKMPIGPFKVRLEVTPVDDNGNAINGGQSTFTEDHSLWLIPFWLIVLVIVILVVLVVSIIWWIAAKATRRRDARKAKAAAQAAAPPAEHTDG